MNIIVKGILHIVNIGDCCKALFRCKYKGNETFCSFKIVICQKGTWLFTSVFNFLTVIRFKLQSSERFKWSEFNISDPNFKFTIPQCNYRVKTSQPIRKLETKITNLRFASLFVEICRYIFVNMHFISLETYLANM
jgi:hypothetical protein